MTEVAPAVAGTDAPGDAALIAAVRGGDLAAFGELYERHLGAARRVAAAIAADAAERDDLIAEGFTRVLRILRNGDGPDEDFRPYLLTTIRNTMVSWRRRDSTVSVVAEVPDVSPAEGSDEPVDSRLHATVAADAFASLPERWRTVLWRTEIDGDSPAKIAEDLGMTPNGVAALAYRAREGLRQAYLGQHVPEARRRNCKNVSGQLARWVRDDISDLKAHRITVHLDRCTDCRKLATGLQELNEELPATVAPLILGLPIITHWLTTGSSFASSGAVAGTGASVLSWATAAKVAAAGAVLVTTVTIGASTSGETPPPLSGGAGTTTQTAWTSPAAWGTAGQAVPAGPGQVSSDPQLTSAPGAAPADETAAAGEPEAAQDSGTATNDNQAAKESKLAAKESRQAAKQSSRSAAKESRKAEKSKTSETPPPTG